MDKVCGALIPVLGIGAREHIALVGGGGKTSLVFALAEECRQAGMRVLTATTTKVWHREALRAPRAVLVQTDADWRQALREGLERHGHVFLGCRRLDSGKVQGIHPSLADELYQDGAADYLLIEADGASGRPVKAPAGHEPVIPDTASMVIAVMGLEALGCAMAPEVVFRMERFGELTGCRPGERLSSRLLTGLFAHPRGLFKGTPIHARRIVFLNKWDLLEQDREAQDLARMILEKAGDKIRRVVIGSIEKGLYRIMGKRDERDIRQDS